tara:strand:+ start:512 stop:943 length:432 start_codon:yes stop_codon:yes gene_type:complete
MSKVENGNMVSVHYTGTLKNGTEFDSSKDREPLGFQVGGGQVIAGFNDAIVGMVVGESKTFTIPAEQAYGPKNEEAVQQVPRTQFPNDYQPVIGGQVTGQNEDGQTFAATVISDEGETITLDFNHPLAGQDLTFNVELVSVDG